MKQDVLIKLPVIYDAGGDLSKKWFIEFYVRNPRNGKLERQRKAKGINKFHKLEERLKAAEKMKQYWFDELQSGWNPYADDRLVYDDNLQFQTFARTFRKAKSQNGTFKYYASKFLDHIKNDIDATGTLPTYRSKLRMFDAWLSGKDLDTVDVSCINQPMVSEFFSVIIEERMLSKTSVQKYAQILFSVFEYIRKERKVFMNPVFDLPKTKRINDQTPRPIREQHIVKLKESLKKEDPQLLLAAKFEYYCCLRPGKELRLLKIKDIDLFRGTIDVSRFRSKTKLARIVTIPDTFLEELRDLELDSFPTDHYVIGENGKPGSSHLGKNNLRQRWQRIREKLNLPFSYKLYSWKHTGNVRADDAGIPREDLQQQNGHRSIRTTEVYLQNKTGRISSKIRKSWPEL